MSGVFLLLAGYLGWISQSGLSAAVGSTQGSRSVTVAVGRGTIYDRNLQPLVNQKKEYRAAILPNETVLTSVRRAMEPSAYLSLLDRVSDGSPAVAKLQGPVAIAEGMALFYVPVRYGTSVIAPHLVGYLDESGQRGMTGLEYAYNDLLASYHGTAVASFSVNGAGMYLAGEPIKISNTLSVTAGGLVTTLDCHVQRIAEEVAQTSLIKGAVVILEPKTGDVLASVSVPTYHPDTLADSLEQADGALINRALGLYDCGSVFKIVTAAAALEAGVPTERTYTCSGSITVGETRFHCHERLLGHQELDMNAAFAQSCNLYFIQLAREVGGEKLLEAAEKLGLTLPIDLAGSIQAPAGIFPAANELTVPAALANLSFGQGKLLLTPLHIARMTAAVANGGTLPSVSLISGTVDGEGKLTTVASGVGEAALSPKTAALLQGMMELAVTDGTGRKAQLSGVTSAGKTGTAQTGQLNNDAPVIQSWFTGYFPAKTPQYVICVLAEDAEINGTNAAKTFCEISNKLLESDREQTN